LKRAPQLGAGIRVDPKGAGGLVIEEEAMVPLSAEQQTRIIAALEQNQRLPASVRERLVARIKTGSVPAQMADRLEQILESDSGAPAPAVADSGEMVILSEAERARLIAAVNGSSNMPEEVKTRIVERLSEPEVSKEAYDSITARIGG
jgi:hypothetical protein